MVQQLIVPTAGHTNIPDNKTLHPIHANCCGFSSHYGFFYILGFVYNFPSLIDHVNTVHQAIYNDDDYLLMYFDDKISASPAAKIKSNGANIGLS